MPADTPTPGDSGAPLNLDAIRARLDAATAGPWWVEAGGPDETCDLIDGNNRRIATFPFYAPFRHEENETFIAHAREDVPRLLAEVDRLTAERDELAATLANERGEGEPPVPGWTSCRSRYDDGSRNGTPRIEWYCNEGRVVRALNGWHWASCLHEDMVYHRGEFTRSGTAPTAREAIRLASDAARGAK